MPSNTGNRGYTYPTLADSNDVPFYIQTLAEQIDADVDRLNDPAPVSPVYQAGWGDYPAASNSYLGLSVTRSAAGLIGLSGMFSRTGGNIGATSAAQFVATLPEGYRPSKVILTSAFGAHDGGTYNTCRINILPTGRIEAVWITGAAWTGTGSAWVSLAGLSFVAAA